MQHDDDPTTTAAGPDGEMGQDPWARAELIAAEVRPPSFPERYVDVREHGAVGDGHTDCSAAFAAAIEACHAAGGGHVVVPAGEYRTGPIRLLSRVDLHVTADARILFSQDPADYLPAVRTLFEGVELYGYSPLVHAVGQHDIAVTGEGVLDGQADEEHWWPWKGKPEKGWTPGEPHQGPDRDRLFAMAEAGVPVEERRFGDGAYLRSSFIQPYRCSRVWIEGVTVVRSPMWVIHPVLSDHVLVERVRVESHGPNNDGFDPESCRMVVVRDCFFDTGDDCIAIKAGRNADGRRIGVPCEDLLIEGCQMRDGHGGITIGSEMSGGVRHVFARSCELSSPHLDIALRFKTNSARGGFITDFHARDITVGRVASSVVEIDLDYEEGAGHGFNPVVAGISVERLTAESARRSLTLRGYPEQHVRDVRLTEVHVARTTDPPVIDHVDGLVLQDVTENGRPLRVGASGGAAPAG